MADFYHIILRAINDYKYMLRRNLEVKQYVLKIRELGIKRKHIKNAHEVELYAIGLKIISELEANIDTFTRERKVNFYYGAEKFLQHLKDLLTKYTIKDGRVVHTLQNTSRALINVIQLIEKAKERLTDEMQQEIHYYSSMIVKYGNAEQKKIFSKIIPNDPPSHMILFFQQLQKFLSSCLDEA